MFNNILLVKEEITSYMKLQIILYLFLINNIAFGQLNDNFGDGDFTTNPTWGGSVNSWIVNTNVLQLDTTDAGYAYLSTSSTAINDASWEFWLNLDFNPSSSNLAKIYLAASQPFLNENLQGYFVQIGDSEDEISLYYQDGNTTAKIIDGADSQVDLDPVILKIKVTRDAVGNWELFTDIGSTGTYTSAGTAFDDNLIQSNYFGILAEFTSTRADKFFFDDISVIGNPYVDTDPPTLTAVNVLSANQLSLIFSEPLQNTSASNVDNYLVDNGIGNPVTASNDPLTPNVVELQFSTSFQDAEFHNITVENVADAAGNLLSPLTEQFFYYEDKDAQPLQIVINELHPDPSPVVSLPETEFIELYNNSSLAFNLKDWTISDNTSTGTLEANILQAGEFLILIPTGNASAFSTYGDVLEINNWPSLNNSGDTIYLKDNNGVIIDSAFYNPETYQDNTKTDGGWSLEKRFPSLTCPSINNWLASEATEGGTPGSINSVFTTTPDIINPIIERVAVTSSTQVNIIFSEKMDESSLATATYSLQPANTLQSVTVSEDALSAILTFNQPFVANQSYQLTIENATDCIGNLLVENVIDIAYDVSVPQLLAIIYTSATEMDLLFDEVLLADSANNAQNYILNDTTNPANANLINTQQVALSFDTPYNLTIEQKLTIRNLSDLNGNIINPAKDTTFTFDNEIDTVIVESENQISIKFSAIPEKASAESLENYQLDGSVNPVAIFEDEKDEMTYHLIFTNNFESNSNYQLYVKNMMNVKGERMATPAFSFIYDDEAPSITNISVVNATHVFISFDDKLDPATAAVLINYEVNKSIGFPESLIIENDSAVSLYFNNSLLQNELYTLEINNVKDIYGNIMTNEQVQFIFDPQAPMIEKVQLIHPNLLLLTFSEDLQAAPAQDNTNYLLNNVLIPGATINLLPYKASVIQILFEALEDDSTYTLNIKNLADANGNAIPQSINVEFNTYKPTVGDVEVLADSIIQVQFSEPIEASSAGSVSNYLLNQSVQPVELEHTNATIKLTFDQHFTEGDTQQITIKNLNDLTGNTLDETSRDFVYQTYVETITYENANTLVITFSLPIDVSKISESDFALEGIGNPFLLLPVNNVEETIKLVFNTALQDGVSYQLLINTITDKYNRIIPASANSILYDTTPPEINSITMDVPKQLNLIFSEDINEESFVEQFYQIAGFGTPINVTIDGNIVILTFADSFVDQQNYTLEINGVTDVAGNLLINYSYPFTYVMPQTAQFNQIVITEIMANPSPPVALPEAEYLEIFNSADVDLPLNDLIISDGSRDGKLMDAMLPSGGYAILCANNNVAQFEPYGQTIGVTSMPGLNNTGETLLLKDTNGNILFSVSYDQSLYKDIAKANGGYSLEMIDTNNPCGGQHNWTATESNNGGTPGEVNSVAQPNPDNIGPQLTRAVALDASTLQLTFNEKLDYSRYEQLQIELDPQIGIASKSINSQLNQLIVTLQQPLQPQQGYQLTVVSAWDCLGNAIDDEQNKAVITLPEAAAANEVVINEILFNPRSGGVEFVELYNTTEKNILLDDVALQTSTSFNNLQLPYVIIPPFEFVVITENANILKADYPSAPLAKLVSVEGMPSLNNDESSLSLFVDNIMLDSVYYNSNFHFALLNDEKGVSLERIYSDQPALDENNWQSAVAQVGFATPAAVNSQARTEVVKAGSLTADPPTFAPGDPGGRSFTSINYQFEEPGNLATLTIHDVTGRVVRSLIRNETLANNGLFIWDGINDQGQQVRIGSYLIVMEVYNLEGELNIYKERVAVGRNF